MPKSPLRKTPFSFPWWSVPLIGASIGLGTYGLSRIPKFVSKSRFPVLRALQELAGGEMALHAPALQENADLIKEIASKKSAKGVANWRSMVYGPEVRWLHGKMPETISGEEAPKMIYTGYKRNLPEGIINPALGPVTGAEHRKLYDLAQKIENKARQARLTRKYAPEMMPDTISLQELRRKYNLPLRRGKHFAEDLKAIQRAAEKHLGGEALIKPSGPRLGGDVGAASMGAFPTTSSNLVKLQKDWRKIRKAYWKSHATTDFLSTQDKFSRMPAYKGRVVDEMLANNVLFQRKVPIKRLPSGLGGHEYRVHTVGGKAIPSMAVPWEPPHSLRDRISQKIMARRAARWVQKQIDKLPEKYKNLSMAVDVAPLEGGGFRAFELNPGGKSGFLGHPGAAHKLYRALTGRSTKDIALTRAILAGLGTTGTAGLVRVTAPDKG